MNTCIIAQFFKTLPQAQKELERRKAWPAKFSILETDKGFFVISNHALSKFQFGHLEAKK